MPFRMWFFRVISFIRTKMQGRYGFDSFGLFLSGTALVLSLIPYASYLGLGIFFYALIRTFSKDLEKRRAEARWYERTIGSKIRKWTIGFLFFTKRVFRTVKSQKQLYKMKRKYKNTHHVFQCKGCLHKLKVPKNKGKVKVICPACGCEQERMT